MKLYYPQMSIKALCGLFGKTRHAYYDRVWRSEDHLLRDEIVLQCVAQIRISQPRIGARKLHYLLNSSLEAHKIQIGRDYLFDLLAEHKLLIRTRKRKAITTDSRHWMKKYPNLIRELIIERPEQVWASDITYLRIPDQFIYLSLITDSYSKKIVGYHLQDDLSSTGCLNALSMAINGRRFSDRFLIHHSDRGSQYCCKEYVGILKDNNIGISMTERGGDPYQNPIAERINGILKTEFGLDDCLNNFTEALELVERSIYIYNNERPHLSCNYLTPMEAEEREGLLKRNWKNYRKPMPEINNV